MDLSQIRVNIDNFLNSKSISMVGVSSNPNHFSRVLLKEFVSRGYEMELVNPHAGEIDGVAVLSSVSQTTADHVLIITASSRSKGVVEECNNKEVKSSVKSIWF
ncbi:MAG: CoA-binding protein [Candidatus Heimdallarchaeota archaeon]|nr:CoA-binding protein [Candidatus Heimdallarchaeota archaeon]